MTDENVYFVRNPHDRENPYAQISRAMARDKRLSLACRGLLVYLLSMRDDFKINIKALRRHVAGDMGRDQLYKIVQEALDGGYMKREDILVNNLRRGVKYFVAEKPIFKKFLRRPGFRDPENQEALRKSNIVKKEYIKKNTQKEKPEGEQTQGASHHASANASLVCDFLLSKIKEIKPDFSKTPTPSWRQDAGRLLKIRAPDKLREIIEWVFQHEFWSMRVQSPCSLLKNLDLIESQMQKELASPKQKASVCQKIADRNRDWMYAVKARFAGNSSVDCSIYECARFRLELDRYESIAYESHGFREQVINVLRKMDLPIDGL